MFAHFQILDYICGGELFTYLRSAKTFGTDTGRDQKVF